MWLSFCKKCYGGFWFKKNCKEVSEAKAKYLMRKLKNLSKLKTGIKMKEKRKHFSSVRERADADLPTLY